MEILLWLAPTVVVTCAAMVGAAWIGREREDSDRRSERAQARFARAIQKQHPAPSVNRPRPARVRSTGIAVRATRPPDRPSDSSRRSA